MLCAVPKAASPLTVSLPLLDGHMTDNVNIAFHLGYIAIAGGAMITRREWYHKTMSVVSAVTFSVYIAVLFGKLH